jgi:hypothetical protein
LLGVQESIEATAMRPTKALGHEKREWPSYDFGSSISEHPFSTTVPKGDLAQRVGHYDGIRRRFRQRTKRHFRVTDGGQPVAVNLSSSGTGGRSSG